ncbi:hypothetical protein L1987_55987 [Smallanthus sonchifolius]|uniref:Uncharacterized protein n=1 Tax=Smallanthus sonchifolius TaxID=185202 RepID=A0ACB9EBT1_9ASTR|nr:hypothetical protein L1987_55987 [Smallanthus sonchifolius]
MRLMQHNLFAQSLPLATPFLSDPNQPYSLSHHHTFSLLFLHSLKSRFLFLSLFLSLSLVIPSCLLNRRSTKVLSSNKPLSKATWFILNITFISLFCTYWKAVIVCYDSVAFFYKHAHSCRSLS